MTNNVAMTNPRAIDQESKYSPTCRKLSALATAASGIALAGLGAGLLVAGVAAPFGVVLLSLSVGVLVTSPFVMSMGIDPLDVPGGDSPAIPPRSTQVPYNFYNPHFEGGVIEDREH